MDWKFKSASSELPMNKRNTYCTIALLSAGVLACTSTPSDSTRAKNGANAARNSAEAAARWTKEFQKKSILIAREIAIEGPPGLIAHVALKQLPDQRYSARTTAEGFLQEVSVADDSPQAIWIQLDNLAINAVRSARVLERVSDGPVRIRASGEAYWKNLETGEERRAESIELVGPGAQ